ncbi:MAG: hypothetical protein MdMp014T_0735 [Treponematales bacterium]
MSETTSPKRTRLSEPAVLAFHKAACGLKFGSVSLRFEVFRGGFNACEIEAAKTLSENPSSGRVYQGEPPLESQAAICALAAEIEEGTIEFRLHVRDGLRQFTELSFKRGVAI